MQSRYPDKVEELATVRASSDYSNTESAIRVAAAFDRPLDFECMTNDDASFWIDFWLGKLHWESIVLEYEAVVRQKSIEKQNRRKALWDRALIDNA